MVKKKVVHFIFDLTPGEAQTMLVRVIKKLKEYGHTIVTIFQLHNIYTAALNPCKVD